MRKETDTCLLCKTNLAVKTNSHIFPKFLSTSFLGAKGVPRKGFDLSSHSILEQKPKVIQDSPKEDYILCEECESYFSILEGISSDTFINWKAKVESGDYRLNRIVEGFDILECNTANKRTIQLLIYSIFWRVSISKISLFDNLNIVEDFEEDLRLTLMNYKAIRRNDFLSKLDSIPNFIIYPTSILTANSFTDETANMLYAPFSYEPYSIIVDKFSFMLFRNPTEIKVDFIKAFSNITIDDCRMMILSEESWHKTIVKKPFDQLAEQAIRDKNKI